MAIPGFGYTYRAVVCFDPTVLSFNAVTKKELDLELSKHRGKAVYALVMTLRDGKAIHAEKVSLKK